MSKRTSLADLLKGIAVILMIQVHILELFASPQIFSSTKGSFLLFFGGPFVAPIFAVVFGYFIGRSNLAGKQIVVRGVKLFFVGFLLNLLLNTNLFISIYQGKLQLDPLPYVFGVDFLLFAGLAIILLGALNRLLKKRFYLAFILSLLFAFLGEFLLKFHVKNEVLQYIIPFIYGNSHWSYFPLLPWIAYPLFGFGFSQLQQRILIEAKINKETFPWYALLGIVFIGVTLNYAIKISADLQTYYHHGIVFFLWTIVFIFFYAINVNRIDQILGNAKLFQYIKWLGKNVTSIYFIQWVLIGNIGTEVFKTISNPVILITSFIGVLTASSLFCWVYLKLKYMFRTK